MKKDQKTYGTPDIEVIKLATSDILTLSNVGFEGEEHEFVMDDPLSAGRSI